MATNIENPDVQSDFIDQMQTEVGNSCNEVANDMNFIDDIEKYRQMIPYGTSDPEKISQQESILELLISNGICGDETFKIFIAEPDLHKEKASQILDSLYCVSTMISNEYENDGTTEWLNSVESMAPGPDTPNATVSTDLMELKQSSDGIAGKTFSRLDARSLSLSLSNAGYEIH